jgi:ATP-binding cassette subfamily B (MDR/TAP) protein 1
MLQAMACCAAIASGAGVALQNLIFGRFISVITDFATQKSTQQQFRQDGAKLAYISKRLLWEIYSNFFAAFTLCI